MNNWQEYRQFKRDSNNGTDEANNVETDTSIERLYSTLILGAVSGAVIFLAFLVLARLYKKFYQPRKERWFKTSWWWRLFVTTDSGIINTRGPDCIIYLRLVRSCLYITGIMLIGFIVLMVINHHGTNKDLPDHDDSKTSGLSVYTMSNLDNDSPFLWAHLVVAYLFSFGVYLAVYFNTTRYLNDKQKWLGRCSVREYTVLFQDLRENQSTEPQMTKWCEKWYPASVISCNLVRQTPKLTEDREAYVEFRDKLEGAEYELQTSKKGIRPTTRAGGYLWGYIGGTKVDAIEYYTQQMQECRGRIEAALSCPREMYPATGSALITFDSTFIARAHHFPTIAPPLSSLSPKSPPTSSGVSAMPAPEPKDVIWENMHIPAYFKIARGMGVFVSLAILVCFWGIPVAFVTSITQLDNLSKLPEGKWIRDVIDITPFARGLIEGFLPPLVLVILAHLPIYIIKFLVSLIGLPSHSKTQKWVFNAYYYFMLVNILLIAALAGGVFGVLDDMIDHPTSIADRLAQTMPRQSTYFISFLIIHGATLPLELLRLSDWLEYMVRSKFIAKSPRQQAKLLEPKEYYYANRAAGHVFMFTITLLFSVMAPLVIVFGFTYFFIAYYIEKYSMIYVYKKVWEAGGFIWDAAVPQFFVATLLFQTTMIGLFGLNQFYPGAIGMLPLLPASLVVWYMCYRLIRRARWGPVEDARDGEPFVEDGDDVDTDDEEPENHNHTSLDKNDKERRYQATGEDDEEDDDDNGEADSLIRGRRRGIPAASAEAVWMQQQLGNAYVQPSLRPLFDNENSKIDVHNSGYERSPRTHHLQGLAHNAPVPSVASHV